MAAKADERVMEERIDYVLITIIMASISKISEH
jgi:hypothetical protein